MLDRTLRPEVSDFGFLKIPTPETIHLDNGIEMRILNNGNADVCNIFVLWNAGDNDVESPKTLMLMCDSINDGTISRSGEEIASIFEDNGAWIKFQSYNHFTSASLFSLNSNLANVLPTFIDVIQNPAFSVESVSAKLSRLLTTVKISREKVTYQAALKSVQMIYGQDYTMGHEESVESISGISPEDLRQLHKKIMRSITPVIFLSGKITDEIKSIVADAFGKLTFDATERVKLKIITPQTAPAGKTETVYMEGKNQCCVRIAIPTINRTNPDFLSLKIAVNALGGYFGSRLMSNIREEKGYTYGISAWVNESPDGNYVCIVCECDNKYVQPILKEVVAELNKLRETPMPADELLEVRRSIMTTLAKQLDTPFSIMQHYINSYISSAPDAAYSDMQKTLFNETPEHLCEIAGKYLNPTQMRVAIAGGIEESTLSK